MAKQVHASGKVIKGDFNGCYVIPWDNDLWYVIGDGKVPAGYMHEGPVYKVGFLQEFFSPDDLLKYINDNKKYEITTAKIDRIVDAASFQTTPSASAFVDGSLTAGVGYGIAKAMSSARSSKTLAVYTTDGKKILIEFYSSAYAAHFQNDLFKF